MKRSFLIILACCLLLTGCVKQQILDRVNLFIVCAFDKAVREQIEFTMAATKYRSKQPGAVSNRLLSNVGETSVGIKGLMDLQLSRPINTGKVSVILFGKDLAEKGISKQLDVVSRDAQASQVMYLAIVNGNAKELLHANFSSDEEKGMYLFNLLDSNVKNGSVPRQNLHEFEYAYLGKGLDPFLPLLQLQGEHVKISGLALFKNDKHVASLNEKEMFIFKLLYRNLRQGTIEADSGNGSRLAMKIVRSKVRYKVMKGIQGPRISINLSIKGEVIDAMQNKSPDQNLQQIRRLFEKDLTKNGMNLIHVFKTEKIDPLGLGDLVRSHTRGWKEEEWLRQYPQTNVALDVNVEVVETGIQK
ncbi:Ger(x)C family spore germination protein [Paenibacillus glycinis]|uniref:Ger(X)C family spore germination protein n=1 Tax=Paenibacillus glycinis TaxID=2697035 RepID=A0ABW9XQR4_9BACL|nr:Ger(x)C family spore germination protein [Paenibacillus glycinis]NBD24984.1 Ger(x)C family spore germination protein [Paenibacillus glycinis]